MNYHPMKVVALSIIFFLTTILSTMAAPQSNRNEYHARVHNLNTVIDIKMNDLVEEQIDFFINKKRKTSRYILGRTSLYFPKIENALREKGMPDELKYIAVVESELQPEAVSRQGAAGLWQFMKGTALLYGMEVSKYIDERKDVDISTEKAIIYLETLYNIYENWTVALAAYNCGPGNVNRAIKRAGGVVDYWAIAKYLPRETRYYIPKFIAISYLMNYYYLHDISPIEPENEYKYVGSVKVFDKINLRELHKELGVDFEIVQKLNPIYVKGIIPASKSGQYKLTLPESALITYLEKTNTFENIVHMSSSTLVNSIFQNKLLATGSFENAQDVGFVLLQQKITPVTSLHHDLTATLRNRKSIPAPKKISYLKRKQSLADLALENDISLEELMRINNIKDFEEVALHQEIILADNIIRP